MSPKVTAKAGQENYQIPGELTPAELLERAQPVQLRPLYRKFGFTDTAPESIGMARFMPAE